jgi:hypothetical protein
MQIRDWLYVKDHCSAIRLVLEAGRPGETYNVGGWNEKPNIEIVSTVCALLDEKSRAPMASGYAEQITYVKDRPATTAATRSTPRRSSASWAGSPPRPSRPASARPCSGTWTTGLGAAVQSGDVSQVDRQAVRGHRMNIPAC